MDQTTKADRIRIMLDSKGINQADAAAIAKITRSALSQNLSGKTEISQRTMELLAKHCGFDPYWAWTGQGDPKPKSPEPTDSDRLAEIIGAATAEIDAPFAGRATEFIRSVLPDVALFLLRKAAEWDAAHPEDPPPE